MKETVIVLTPKLKQRLIYLFIFVGIMTLAFIIVMMLSIKENNSCLIDPFHYGMQQLKEKNGEYQCTCIAQDRRLLDFKFNSTALEIITPEDFNKPFYEELSNMKLNFSV